MKQILFCLVFLIIILNADAQIQYGPKGGMNLAKLVGKDISSTSEKVGFNAGGFVNIPIFSSLCVQAELLYSLQGSKKVGGIFYLNYINIPLLLQYKFGGFLGEIGPQFGSMLSAKTKPTNGNLVSINGDFKSSDFSLAMGVGYQFKNRIGIDARYNLGLVKIAYPSGDVENRVFTLAVFYNLGKTETESF